MSVFAIVESDSLVQVGDKIRFNANQSFVGDPAITIVKYEINPNADDLGSVYIDVTDNKYLDWAYSAASEEKEISLQLTDSDGTEYTKETTIEVISVADDKLISTDSDLLPYEPDIKDYLPKGKSSFNHVHREARKMIVKSFGDKGYKTSDGTALTIDNFHDKDQLKSWSKFMVLRLIFESQSNQSDDIFNVKAIKYKTYEDISKNISMVSLDLDADGTHDIDLRIGHINLVRG